MTLKQSIMHMGLTALLTLAAEFVFSDPSDRNSLLQPWLPTVELYSKELLLESMQFQFQIGTWDIISKRYDPRTGTLLSEAKFEQHIEYRDNKRFMVEETIVYSPTTGKQIGYGIALRTYSANEKLWQVTFLSSHSMGPASTYKIKKVGDEMHGMGEFQSPQSGTVKYRIRFFNIAADSYQWEQKYSLDGEHWYLERTQEARRKLF